MKMQSFTCNKCKSEFELEDGGICSICSKSYCLLHFKEIDIKQNKVVCIDCYNKSLEDRKK